ncbi:PhoU domain-containing protein, partial [Nostoc sp. NIES-2111]
AGTVGSMNGFDRIAGLVLANFDAVVESFEHDNVEMADRVRGADEDVDRIYDGIFRELLTHMAENPRNITIATHLMFVAKNFERIGDQATNIAEMVHFITKGDLLPDRHSQAGEAVSGNGGFEAEAGR